MGPKNSTSELLILGHVVKETRTEALTDAEANDEYGNGQKSDNPTDAKLLSHLIDARSDDTARERDDEASDRHDHRVVPLEGFAPVLGVLGIVDRESDKSVVFYLPRHIRLDGLNYPAFAGLFRVLIEIRIFVYLSKREVGWVDSSGDANGIASRKTRVRLLEIY